MASRYVIGIDLGTTNCAVCYVDTQSRKDGVAEARVLSLAQLESAGVMRAYDTLPSFLYLAPEGEEPFSTVGVFAREQTALLPGRVIHSAKSWLVQPNVDPQEKILPWGSSEISAARRLSPVEVSARYLTYLHECWDREMPAEDARFDRQDITITVPASFDEAAQYATLEAAKMAGFPSRVRLLEEPQAALYCYLERREESGNLIKTLLERLPNLAVRSQTVLVCDIGGGTTDFSLFEVLSPTARQRIPRVQRIAVSDHLLVAGDNIDLAIAFELETKLGRKLSPRQWSYLVFLSRGLKERVLSEEGGEPHDVFHISLPGGGSGLLQSTATGEITRARLRDLVLEGFFPWCDATDYPRRSLPGLREWGLSFPADSAVTRHLASFLHGREVDAVLFNGGTLKPCFLQERLRQQIAKWQGGRLPECLPNAEMDLAVARGAATYGAVLRRTAGRIRGGYPHAIYLELSRENRFEPARLVCLLPRGFEPGDKLKIDQLHFKLLLNQPVRFQLYYSNARTDAAGDVLVHDDSFRPLPPLQTQLRLPAESARPSDGMLDISLEVTLSETGMLQVYCAHTEPSRPALRWQLDFNLRKQSETAEPGSATAAEDTQVPPERLQKAQDRIALFYGKKKIVDLRDSPKGLKHELESILGRKREDWNLALLRSLWTALAPGITRRVRSEAHEVSWLYLAGYCLRPGYGSDLDRWRISELWRCFSQGPAFPKNNANANQWWILWRRISGGLDLNQQAAIYARLVGHFRAKPEPPPEMVLLAGSLERLATAFKIDLGNLLIRRLGDSKTKSVDQHLWALGRVANRVPLYAGIHSTVDIATVQQWVERVLEMGFAERAAANLALFLSQACALTGDRARDVDPGLRLRVLECVRKLGATAEQVERLEKVVEQDRTAQARLFGEELPAGLKLVGDAA